MRAVLALVVVLCWPASVSAGPLRETLKWSAVEAAGQLGGDHLSSWWVDNHTQACKEDNPMLARADGTYATGKGWAVNLAGIGGLGTALYLGKRLHKPRLERAAKVAIGYGAGSGAYFGLHNWIRCGRGE